MTEPETTIAGEWESFSSQILSRFPSITPELCSQLRTVFYAGATAAWALVVSGTMSPDGMGEELREAAENLRGALQ